ncbi:MAG: hypothetical protein GXO65_02810 [Euryarchaeota archaeon]|nr:hypothetical protein [Euryarchaeota archaeon]
MPTEDLVEDLDRALLEAVEKAAVGEFGVLFSGGLDSSLIVKYCMDLGRRPVLYSAGMAGSGELRHVREAGSAFGLEHRVVVIAMEDLPGLAGKVAAITGDPSPMTVGIGVPLYAAMKRAGEDGLDCVLCGQGADELFGGYHRYKAMEGAVLEEALRRDAEAVYRRDLQRDLALAEACSVRLKAPYLDPAVAELAGSIPVSWKLRGGRGKVILREVGRLRGLPEAIYDRKKKAVQYSSGVDRALRKLARREGRPLGEYLRAIV